MGRKRPKKFVIGLFILYLCIALTCFGVCVYLMFTYRGTELADDRIINICKILALIGLFFLVVTFGTLLPALIKESCGISKIFEEENMRKALEQYIPAGETLLAGIHAVAKESKVTSVYGKCVRTESKLIPHENGSVIALDKKKYSAYDIYLGITQYSLIIAECEKCGHLYQFQDEPDVREMDVQEITSEILFTDIGTCFPLAAIQGCQIKKGWMGSVKCFITMKNGSYFKIMLPKLGGLGGGMPHHTEYREAILARLARCSA